MQASALERAVLGALLLSVPDAVTGVIAGQESRPPAWLVRVLGTRLLFQGLSEWAWPRRSVLVAGAVVDTAHAASMVAAATRQPAYRRAASASAVEAAFSAALGAALAQRQT